MIWVMTGLFILADMFIVVLIIGLLDSYETIHKLKAQLENQTSWLSRFEKSLEEQEAAQRIDYQMRMARLGVREKVS